MTQSVCIGGSSSASALAISTQPSSVWFHFHSSPFAVVYLRPFRSKPASSISGPARTWHVNAFPETFPLSDPKANVVRVLMVVVVVACEPLVKYRGRGEVEGKKPRYVQIWIQMPLKLITWLYVPHSGWLFSTLSPIIRDRTYTLIGIAWSASQRVGGEKEKARKDNINHRVIRSLCPPDVTLCIHWCPPFYLWIPSFKWFQNLHWRAHTLSSNQSFVLYS